HAIFTVYAGTSFGTPLRTEIWRAGFGPPPAWRALPKIVSFTCSGSTPARSIAAFAATTPMSAAVSAARDPPNLPMGVTLPTAQRRPARDLQPLSLAREHIRVRQAAAVRPSILHFPQSGVAFTFTRPSVRVAGYAGARRRNMNRSLFFAASLIILLSASDLAQMMPSATLSDKPLSQRVVAYVIDAHLDTSRKTIDAVEILTWHNYSGQPQDTFPFHVYLNGFQPQSTFINETRQDDPEFEWEPRHYGAEE